MIAVAAGSNRYSYVYDPQTSVSLLIDQSNAVKESYGYSAYGAANAALTKTASGFDPKTNPYRYTGKRLDQGSGTYDMGARRYSAQTGRFLQYDLFHAALDNLGLSEDPLTQNRYALAGAKPINFVEIDGHRPALIDYEGGGDWLSCRRSSPGCMQNPATSGNISLEDVGNFLYTVSGAKDIVDCVQGSSSSCSWAAVGILAFGRAVKIAKIGLRGEKANRAELLIREAHEETASSRKLRRSIGNPKGGYAHHIVAWNDPRAAKSKALLLAHGIGPNEAIKGVIIHKAGNHPTKYYRTVDRRLERALDRVEGQDWYARRAALQRELSKIKRDIAKGKLDT